MCSYGSRSLALRWIVVITVLLYYYLDLLKLFKLLNASGNFVSGSIQNKDLLSMLVYKQEYHRINGSEETCKIIKPGPLP